MKAPGYVLGGGLILLGSTGLTLNASQTDPLSVALWFGGGAAVHDLVLVPLVLAVGVPASRLRGPYRVGLVIAGMLALVSLPVVLGLGRRADNPSQLPLNYGANVAVVLASIALVAVAVDVWTLLLRRRRARTAQPPTR
ncbi:hypothetical protein [Microtetraspora glauca]|uniref:Uncharacterized protein n=1 Tax=Microtetraspora glauca TaxID=1996 RepID=A0ABV3GU60_MICGL